MQHEAIFALAGHPGSWFMKREEKWDNLKFIHPLEVALLDRIREVALDYSALKSFIDTNMCKPETVHIHFCETENSNRNVSHGNYLQSLCLALHYVLEPYRSNITCLEKDILNDPDLPLSHITFRAEEYALFLNLLNKMLKQLVAENIRGCQILGFLRTQLTCGVDKVKEAVRNLLFNCHKFFYKQLTSWLLYGQLMDEYKEFFIYCTEDAADHDSSKRSLSVLTTEDMKTVCNTVIDSKNVCNPFTNYKIDFKMLPTYITASAAHSILFIGQTILMFDSCDEKSKSLHYQKASLSIWGEKEGEFVYKLQQLQELPVFDLRKFQMTICELRTCVTEHLWEVAVEKELFQQLKLVKDFYLLGRGELFLEFIQQVRPSLQRGTTIVTSHEINQAFQISARRVLLTDENALDKFYFQLHVKDQPEPEDNPSKREAANWKQLKLCYRVSWPLHLLFTADSLDCYNQLFKFLLRVKKVQADLHNTWLSHVKGCKMTSGAKLHPSVWQLHTALIFVVDHLQYYLYADVLESQWAQMQSIIQNTHDFEKVQHAHNIFQSNILSQTFLQRSCKEICVNGQSPNESNDSICSRTFEANHVYDSIENILNLCETFCEQTANWGECFDEHRKTELSNIENNFIQYVCFLMQILSSLRSQPCGSHLSQLLLRLDFNRWFSHTTTFRSLKNLSCSSKV